MPSRRLYSVTDRLTQTHISHDNARGVLNFENGLSSWIIRPFIAESPMSRIPAGLQVNNVKFLPVVNPLIRAIGIPQQFEPQVKLNPEIWSATWISLMIVDTLSGRSPLYHLSRLADILDLDLFFGDSFSAEEAMMMRRDDFLTSSIKQRVWVFSPILLYLPVMSLHWIDLVFTFRPPVAVSMENPLERTLLDPNMVAIKVIGRIWNRLYWPHDVLMMTARF